MRKKGLRLGLVLVCVFAFSVAFQSPILSGNNAEAKVIQLSMGTATVGGIFYNIGAPIAQCVNKALPDVNITAEFTQGSTENLRLINQKKMQLAVITPMIGYFARKGIKMFKGKRIDFRAVVRLLPNANVWVVLAKSKIKRIPELKGHKVGVGPASGGLGVLARIQLKANGINYKKDIKPYFLGAGAMADALKDGTIEAALLTQELAQMTATTHKIRALSWRDKELKAFLKKNPYFGVYVHPPNTFKGVDYPVKTVDNGIQLICDKDMDEGLVYRLTKAIVENLDCIAKIYAPAKAITPEWTAMELANPFHPGAIKYFKEKGLWKK
ncbi:MAG: TAXI family TRAP transporter solute-binding subunit [Deltaproteobacteria bacterium]|nr:TAXI family TRAP transporter solute-binding subunit [Deltaproteobacteria bacterium]